MLTFLQTIDDAAEFWSWLSDQKFVAVDTETTSLDVYDPAFQVRLVQFGSRDRAWVIPFERWKGLIDDALNRFDGTLVFHNSRYDVSALGACGVKVPWHKIDDTMIALRLAEPNDSAALKSAAVRHVSANADQSQAELHSAMRVNKWSWATVPIDFAPYVFYAAADTVLTARLYDTKPVREAIASGVYTTEMELRALCTTMERNGIRIDPDYCTDQADFLRAEARDIEEWAEHELGFSITSNQQLGKWLLTNHVPLSKATPGGAPSVDKDVLEEVVATLGTTALAGRVAQAALQVRSNVKTASTYFDKFVALRDGDGYVHPDIETCTARTGRMSIRNPPLQTLPRVTDDPETKRVRRAVIPQTEDQVLVSCDSDQIELRLAAALSGSRAMMQAFRDSDDFFTTSMQDIYNDPSIVKSDGRRAAIKTFWYASLYGAGVAKMAISAGVPEARIREVKNGVDWAYPEIGQMQRSIENAARENGGWVTNPYGRRLQAYEGKEYAATNAVIQSTAADVLKRAMVQLGQAGLEDLMLIPVHDEILVSCDPADVDEVTHILVTTMTNDDFDLTLTASAGPPSKTWADCK
jgi:DNA polymerase-1